jgi:hypothetical protein
VDVGERGASIPRRLNCGMGCMGCILWDLGNIGIDGFLEVWKRFVMDTV